MEPILAKINAKWPKRALFAQPESAGTYMPLLIVPPNSLEAQLRHPGAIFLGHLWALRRIFAIDGLFGMRYNSGQCGKDINCGASRLREIGVLLVVFVPLDSVLRPIGQPHWIDIALFAVGGLAAIVVGSIIETS